MANISVKIIIDAVNNASKELGKIGDSVSDVGRSFVVLGAGATAALGFAAKAAIDYEDAFAGVRKTVEASDSEFSKLSQNLRDIAKSAPISAVELAGIAMMAGQLGVTGVDNIAKFTDTIAKFTSATGVAGDEAASSFAQIANVMQEPIKNIDRMGSVVAKLGDSGAATERQILEFSARIAGAGKIAGLTTKDIFGIGSAMASVGIEAEAGGTAVQKVLIDMNTAAVLGGEDLETFAKTSGMTVKQFVSNWGTDAQGTFTKFVEGLGKQGDKAILTLSELGLEDQRLIRSFLSLANAGSLLSDQMKIAGVEWQENSRLQEEAAKRYATTASQMQIFKNNVNDVGITLGAALLPAINQIITNITPLILKFSEFAAKHPELIVNILAAGAAVAGLGLVMVTLGAVITAVTTVVAALASPVILIVAGIIALGAGIAFVLTYFDAWDAALRSLIITVGTLMTSLFPFAPLLITLAVNYDVLGIAQGRVKAAQDSLKVSTDLLKGAEDNLSSANLNLEGALLMVERQSRNAKDAITKYGAGSLEAREATHNLNQAEEILNQRQKEVTASAEKVTAAQAEVAKKTAAADDAVKKSSVSVKGLSSVFDGLASSIGSVIGKFGEFVSKNIGGAFGGNRQFGGPVRADTPYVVGERGPEIFMPAGAGSIVPNHAGVGGSGGGTTIQFFVNAETIVNSPTERRGLAEALYKDLRDLARSQNMSVAEYFGG